MNVNGEYRIPAPRERVWQALHDPEALRACIPGCEALEVVGEGVYEGRISTQVGAVSTVFSGRITVSDLDHPRGYTVSAHAQSPTAGYADGQAAVTLAAEPDGTLLGYRARIELGGRLSGVGNRLLHGVAIRMANEFFARLIERLGHHRPGEVPQELAPTQPRARRPVAVQPIGPAAAPAAEALAPAPPPPSPQPAEPQAGYGEPNPRIQRVIIGAGLVFYVFILLLLFWPRA